MWNIEIKELLCVILLVILLVVKFLFDIIVEVCKKNIDFIDKLIDKALNIC